jgi:hypothetical protein
MVSQFRIRDRDLFNFEKSGNLGAVFLEFSPQTRKKWHLNFFLFIWIFSSQSVIGLNMDMITRRYVFVSTKKAGVGGCKGLFDIIFTCIQMNLCVKERGPKTLMIFYCHQESRLEEGRFLLLMLSEELEPLPDTWGLPERPSTHKGRQHDCHLD